MAAKRWRRLRMGLETVLGLRKQGFFIPYRYAATVPPPPPYAALETVFRAAEPEIARVLDEIDARAGALAAMDGPPPRPRWGQDWFPRLDGAAAYALIAARPPKRIVEVGSGHSTRFIAAALADAGVDAGAGAGAGAAHVCIDPAPRADIRALGLDWRAGVLGPEHMALFDALEAGDVAFFDSSHILQPGTDVDIILNRILPALAPGVRVHIHDILLPDPYPEGWAWRGYAEQNGLAGWLHGAYRIVFSSHYAASRMQAATRPGLRDLPWRGGPETSLWLERASKNQG